MLRQFVMAACLTASLVTAIPAAATPDSEPCPYHPVKIDPKCERSGVVREKSPHND
ncbi:hypothetical protein [Mycobacteroides salmoniphilum]|uniref:Uncharacterized protein n=1 Tax=Mycobacteroides salmoniphilum TaxID=404941 RepID=A0A4R8SQH1_9MYCO|nr:hypothetical protein [Mycobacteroides salmoniphilum]TDZ94711.1 hypothetical protein CCUG62472_01522 [Mycobacteroides salmoniphilum]TEA02004.1 hypothetical protein CCUG60884_03128 [Mycobacteroides salmoniphilum]